MSVRYTLRDLETFQKIMESPGRGVRYSVRQLARASGVSRSQVGHLRSGQRDSLEEDQAVAIAEALGVKVLVLFVPPPSLPQGRTGNETTPT